MTGESERTAAGPLKRRDLLQLAGVAIAGWTVAQLLRATTPVGSDVTGNSLARSALVDEDAPRRSAPGATLTMAVFTDYLCPICRVTDAAMLAAAAEDGRVSILFKDWPILSDASTRAAKIALASRPQGIYERLHATLMRERQILDDAVLRNAVESSAGNWQQALRALDTMGEAIEQRLARNRNEAFGLGLAGTPGLLIGGLLINQGLNVAGFHAAFARARSMAGAG
jgi:protein-disulfide isomerase